ncbi:putative cold-shock DNA-binding protein [Streptomyces sp. 846.5]|nr:putative cold-shock DNA-binding protein [Streptomyces sp. 846.5]
MTGKILRFDEVRGYGFIAPSGGGEDVFMHANDLLGEKSMLRPGLMVSFEAEDGSRGLKASRVQLVDNGGAVASAHAAPASVAPVWSAREDSGDGLCDVLSAAEFRQELSEALLESAPTLTAAQILQVRSRVIELARTHNWIES